MQAVADVAQKPQALAGVPGLRGVVVKESAWLVGANAVSRALGLIRGVLVARLLSPSEYGSLTTLVLAAFYLQLFDGGVGYGTLRQIPWLDGLNKEQEAIQLQRQVIGWEMLVGLASVAAIAALAWLIRPSGERLPLILWLILPGYVLGELLRNAVQSYLQSRRRLHQLRVSMVVHAVLDLLLTSVFAWRWGLTGAMAGLSLTALSVTGFLVWQSRSEPVWRPMRLPWSTARTLAGIGLPIMLQTLIWFNMTNVDKIVILSTLDRAALAYYAIAQSIGASLLLISGAVTRVNGPLMIGRLAETSDPAALYPMVRRVTTVLAYGLPILTALVWCVSPLFFGWLLPRYQDAVPLLDVIGVGMSAIGITFGVSFLYVAMGRQMLNTLMLFGSVCLTAALSLLLLALGWGVLGVAVASTISSGIYLTVFLVAGFRMLGRSGLRLAADVGRLLLPVGLCALGAAVLVRSGGQAAASRTWVSVGMLAGLFALGCWRSRALLRGQAL